MCQVYVIYNVCSAILHTHPKLVVASTNGIHPDMAVEETFNVILRVSSIRWKYGVCPYNIYFELCPNGYILVNYLVIRIFRKYYSVCCNWINV